MFDVDRKGLAQLLMNEEPSRFAYELIQNCWDEDSVDRVDVTLEPVKGRKMAKLVVQDNSPNGFADLADAYTLFKPSYKKSIADKRGRFNLGEKIVIAVADRTIIETTTGTVTFDKGVRTRTRKRTLSGSRVTVYMPWTREQIKEVASGLSRLIPPHHIKTYFNGVLLEHRSPVGSINAVLQTVIEREGGSLGISYRSTDIKMYDLREGEEGGIYEMGIPVVTTGDPWHMDICQKVPLTIDRKNVPPSFLRDVRGQALNVMSDALTPALAQEKWADDALESGDCTDEAVNSLMDHRYGKKRVSYDPSDPESNNKATAEGYTVVHGGNMSRSAWDAVRGAGALAPAGRVTPSHSMLMESTDGVPALLAKDWTKNMRRFEDYAKSFALHCLEETVIAVQFYEMGPPAPGKKAFVAAYKPGHLTVNMTEAKQLIDLIDQVEWDDLLIHEFAHHYSSNHLEQKYYDALSLIGARLHRLHIYP